MGEIYRDKKYEAWLEAFGLEYLRCLSEDGFSEDEMAHRMGLEPEILQKWKKKHPEFGEAVALGRPDSDFHVINALYKKATGFNVELKKTYKLKKIDFDPETGKKIREYEELAMGVDETFIPADLSAEKFWLESRQGERWSRSAHSSVPDGEAGGVVIVPEADKLDGVLIMPEANKNSGDVSEGRGADDGKAEKAAEIGDFAELGGENEVAE